MRPPDSRPLRQWPSGPESRRCHSPDSRPAAALQQGTRQPTQVANSVPRAVARLQSTEYDALAIDQSLLEADSRALDTLLNHAGTALPIYVNLALHHCDRVVREAQVAL